jgi:hypothetical protein
LLAGVRFKLVKKRTQTLNQVRKLQMTRQSNQFKPQTRKNLRLKQQNLSQKNKVNKQKSLMTKKLSKNLHHQRMLRKTQTKKAVVTPKTQRASQRKEQAKQKRQQPVRKKAKRRRK